MPDPVDPTPVRVAKRAGKFVLVDRAGDALDGQEPLGDSASARGAAARINETWSRAKAERRSRGAPAITEAVDSLGFGKTRHSGLVARKYWNPTEHPRARGKFAMSLSGEHHRDIGHPHGAFHYGLLTAKRQDLADKFAAGKFTGADAADAETSLRRVALTGKGDYGNLGFSASGVRSLNAEYAQDALRALHDNKPARFGGTVHGLPAKAWKKREARAAKMPLMSESRVEAVLAEIEEAARGYAGASFGSILPGSDSARLPSRWDPVKHPRRRGKFRDVLSSLRARHGPGDHLRASLAQVVMNGRPNQPSLPGPGGREVAVSTREKKLNAALAQGHGAVHFVGTTRTPIWSAYHPTRGKIGEWVNAEGAVEGLHREELDTVHVVHRNGSVEVHHKGR